MSNYARHIEILLITHVFLRAYFISRSDESGMDKSSK